MRLASLVADRQSRAAVLASDQTLVAVSDLLPGGPSDMLDVLAGGPPLWDRLRAAIGSAAVGQPLQSAQLVAPIPRPRRNVLCVGWNYSEHFAEGQGMRGPGDSPQQIPDYPALFTKQPNTVIGPDVPVWHSAPASDELDWEVELAVIVGVGGRDIPEERALDHVFGYTIGNDVSVRDVQRRHGGQWWKGKSFDAHCPLGPWIVTGDELGDPHNLHISLRVNGVTKQDSNTRFMVFRIPRIIKELSTGMRLEPGDVIMTGTPEGVGFARKPPEFLKVGDVMEAEIEKIGVLRNAVAAYEPAAAQRELTSTTTGGQRQS
jgi:2-keto-4-pentenoate hydratase/2-oxohepta-3-ene-1,7-dioic acid hydratase in catechol pathway